MTTKSASRSSMQKWARLHPVASFFILAAVIVLVAATGGRLGYAAARERSPADGG